MHSVRVRSDSARVLTQGASDQESACVRTQRQNLVTAAILPGGGKPEEQPRLADVTEVKCRLPNTQ